MAVGYGKPIPKPEKHATSKGRAKRHEAAIIQQVRAQVAERDGRCRLYVCRMGLCQGESEWAHMAGFRRFETRGKEAEARHLSEGSLMLCAKHHGMYDRHELQITAIDSAKGADGVLRIVQGNVSVLSVPRT
jgi:hypothetical protein